MSLLDSRTHGGVAVLTLDDPNRRNVLSVPLCDAIVAAVADAERDERVNAIVITGRGSAFCAGADLDDLKRAADGDFTNVEAVYRSFMAVANCRLPTIAAVNGRAVGAGLNLALACDIRIAGESAVFDTRFLKLGLHPGGGHGWMLLRAVGWAEAAKMLLLDQPLEAADALRCGLVQQVSPDAALVDAALSLAAASARLPRDLIIETKETMRGAVVSDHAIAFRHETEAQARSLAQPPFQDLVSRVAASIGKR